MCFCLKISVNHAQKNNQCIEKHILTDSLHLPVASTNACLIPYSPRRCKVGGRRGCKVLVFGGNREKNGEIEVTSYVIKTSWPEDVW